MNGEKTTHQLIMELGENNSKYSPTAIRFEWDTGPEMSTDNSELITEVFKEMMRRFSYNATPKPNLNKLPSLSVKKLKRMTRQEALLCGIDVIHPVDME